MVPKNAALFQGLTDFESRFIKPEAFPWEVLKELFTFMRKYASEPGEVPIANPEEWPDWLPCFSSADKPETPTSFIEIERLVHVRGGKGLKSDKNVHVKGPVIFGKDVILRKGAVITGPSYIGDNVVIGQGVRVKSSFILPGTEIVFGTRVSHAVIGRKVRIGPGAVLDDQPVRKGSIEYSSFSRALAQEVINRTGFEQLGLIAGDGCQIGGGTIFAPGVILLPKTYVECGVRLRTRRVYSSMVTEDT